MQATQKQLDYIEILLNDLNFADTRAQRNDSISIRVGRPIKFLDELTKIEASQLIVEFKKLKEERDA